MPYHEILQRQIREYVPNPKILGPNLETFFEEISRTYRHFEEEIVLRDGSHGPDNTELVELTRKLQQRERAMRDGERRLILALQAGGIGTWTWDSRNDALMLDTFVLPLFGRERRGLKGKLDELIGLFPAAEGEALASEIRGCGQTKNSFHSEHPVEWPDGSRRILEIRGRAFADLKNQTMQIAGTLVDITDRKRVEERLIEQKQDLEKVNAELDAFVYTASHDLRAPLRGISSFASFLEEDYGDKLDAEGRDYISEIRKGVQRMSELIEDLLTLSRISRIRNPFEGVDIHEILTHIMDRLRHDIDEYHVEIIIQDDLPKILCDRIKMTEVFVNLISNAIKFSSKNTNSPRIEIGYSGEGRFHRFWVQDNGIGIDPRFKEQIFGMFKRLHSSSEYEGTGAGLSIVQKIIDQHFGRIWVDSEPGKGSRFVFTIAKNLDDHKKIGEILVEQGLITRTQLKETLERQIRGELERPRPPDSPAVE